MIEQLIIYIFEYLAVFCWSAYTVFAILGILANVFYKAHSEEHMAKNVHFVIVTKASRSVKNTLEECLEYTIKNFNRTTKYPITILINQHAYLEPELKKIANKEANVKIVKVPSSYKKELVGKGRAMQYFIENCVKKQNPWYVFIDDDNLITDDKFLYEIPYYEKRGYVVSNPVLMPRRGNSSIAYSMDFIRYFDDLMIFRYFTGLLKKPLLGLHGELLMAKGQFLKQLDSYNIPSVTEDFVFGSQIVANQSKSWQSATVVSIKSPNTIMDLIKQRGRWYQGINMYLKRSPNKVQLLVKLRLILWNLSIFTGWILLPLWIFFWFMPANLFYIFFLGALYYWAAYLYGTWKTKNPLTLLFIPIYGILESLSIWYNVFRKPAEGFEVINKD